MIRQAHRGAMMSDEYIPFCVPPDWTDSWFVRNLAGPSYRLLYWSDGRVGFEHTCDRGDRGVITCAPLLTDHEITDHPCEKCSGLHTVPTVRPSILCSDCGTHGFIVEGRWEQP